MAPCHRSVHHFVQHAGTAEGPLGAMPGASLWTLLPLVDVLLIPAPDDPIVYVTIISQAPAKDSVLDQITAWGTLGAAVAALIAAVIAYFTLRHQGKERERAARAKAETVSFSWTVDRFGPVEDGIMEIRTGGGRLGTEAPLLNARVTLFLVGDPSRSATGAVGPVRDHANISVVFDPPIRLPHQQNVPPLFDLAPLEFTDFDGTQWIRNGNMPPVRKGHARTWFGRVYDRLLTRLGLVRIR